MKFDVTDPNVCPENKENVPVRLSPLRQKLQQKADQVLQKRQLLSRAEIDNRIEGARIRKENSSQDAVIRRVSPKIRRAETQKNRQAYLSEMARKRQEHEESIQNECLQNIKRIREREVSLQAAISEASHRAENAEATDNQDGLQSLAQMNIDLEQLIRNVYAKMQQEQ